MIDTEVMKNFAKKYLSPKSVLRQSILQTNDRISETNAIIKIRVWQELWNLEKNDSDRSVKLKGR